MRTPALLAPLLALPLLLSSCATLNSIISQGPSPDFAGPLVVGQTWTVDAVVDGRPAQASFPVTRLYTNSTDRATRTTRESLDLTQAAQSGPVNAAYSVRGVPTLTFTWFGERAEGVAARYTCTITSLTRQPFSGVLLLQRGGNAVRGTCSAQSSATPS